LAEAGFISTSCDASTQRKLHHGFVALHIQRLCKPRQCWMQ